MKIPHTVRFAPLLLLSGCCSWTQATSTANTAKLEADHLVFIDKYTVSPRPTSPPPLPAGFEDDVTSKENDFDSAARATGWCSVQKQIFINDKNLFMQDVNLVRQQHYFTSHGAADAKAIVKQNYEGLSTTSKPTPTPN